MGQTFLLKGLTADLYELAVGLQYYYASLIMLNLRKSNSVANSGFEAAKERASHEVRFPVSSKNLD